MKIKDGVRFATGEQAMTVAVVVIDRIYEELAYECTVTGGCEGRRPNNLHHRGWALDFRMNDVTRSDQLTIATQVRTRLGDGDGFDVVLHGEGQNIHLHVEYDPKEES